METKKSKESIILDKVSGLYLSETITIPMADLEAINVPRLRVYITRYAKDNGKSFKTQIGLNGELHIMRQADA